MATREYGGRKAIEDKKKPVQVYIRESEIMKIGKFINRKNKTYAEFIEAVRTDVLAYLENHRANL